MNLIRFADLKLIIYPKQSKWLLSFTVGITVFAGLLMWWANIAWPIKLLLFLLLMYSLWYHWRHHNDSIHCIEHHNQAGWFLTIDNTKKKVSIPPKKMVITQWFMVLQFKSTGKNYKVLLTRDMFNPSDWRRLKIILATQFTSAC
ncbi:MAG: hypothetical protein KIT27_02110 [Legionellales bacterium]|nr:hypothetical protein [Legionellales bacterium]